ncbi:sushi, von Willebrand factor type A, EGF and pentraxin domain-containing protein 1-like isoform X4 [Halichondria panicea]|uniref:sushi, von Willebrand factor type A, EGF and pentraxin domain-containing protein 1-like isoform X4 n=1 Tax=Halichondria panicea TaxID=6063 RepID=UPI00312BA7DF
MASIMMLIAVVLSCVYLSSATYLPPCGPPDAPGYGSFYPQKNFYSIGKVVRFSCRDGFLLKGYSFTKCIYSQSLRKAVWKFDTPVCKRITCPDLIDPRYGDVDVTGNTPGSKATYTCDRGFTLVGSSTAKCQLNGKWSSVPPVCKPIFCPKLTPPAYGAVNDGNNRVGTKAVYTCNDGFEISGQSSRKCQLDGTWSGKAPTCILIKCPNLEDPENGSVDDGDNLPGTIAKYTCEDGFRLVGSSKRPCQKDGSWAGEAPICKRIRCPALKDPENGSVDDGDNLPGTIAKYTCDDGFRLVGSSKRLCQKDGSWAGEAPICKRIRCPALKDPENGSVDDGDNLPGTIAKYTCDDGFRLVGSSKRLCQKDGSWAGEAPICKRIRCPALKDPENGSVDDRDNLPGTIAKYTCDDGFRLVGSSKRPCQKDGSWAGEAPICKQIRCPALKDPENGSVDDGDNLPGTIAKYTCDDGFRLVGSTKRLCQKDGSWAGEAPICKQIECPALKDPENGSVDDGDNLPGTIAKYTCDDGFRLVGSSKRPCQKDGSWAGEAPICKQIRCPALKDPENGSVDDGDNLPGTIAKYTCDDGFRLVGSSKRPCQKDSSWAGEAPICKQIRCPALKDPENGSVDDGDNLPGTIAKYTCDDGFRLVGSSKRLCQKDGSWAGEAPICKQIRCPALKDPENGSVDDGDNLPGTIAKYTCDDGFRLVGSSKRPCQKDGSWAGEAPICKQIRCPALKDPENGSVDDGDNLPGTIAKYTCDDGFRLVGSSKRLCQKDGSWAGEAPICKQIECPALKDPENGSVDDGDNLPGTIAKYTCDDGFRLVGSSKRPCQKDGSWAGEAPICKQIRCPALKDPENGSVDDGDNLPGTIAKYTCDDGFRLVGSSKRPCQKDGSWAGEAPICKQIRCPTLQDPENGSVDDGDNLPGTIAKYTCDDGFRLVGSSKRLCQKDGSWAGEAPICKAIICPKLDDPEDGQVTVTGLTPSSTAEYSCNKGFKLFGTAWRKCQVNGEWSGEAPTCKRVDCGRPPKPSYGIVKFWTTTPGSKAFYGCFNGYRLSGYAVRFCQGNGYWSGRTPSCTRRHY